MVPFQTHQLTTIAVSLNLGVGVCLGQGRAYLKACVCFRQGRVGFGLVFARSLVAFRSWHILFGRIKFSLTVLSVL